MLAIRVFQNIPLSHFCLLGVPVVPSVLRVLSDLVPEKQDDVDCCDKSGLSFDSTYISFICGIDLSEFCGPSILGPWSANGPTCDSRVSSSQGRESSFSTRDRAVKRLL